MANELVLPINEIVQVGYNHDFFLYEKGIIQAEEVNGAGMIKKTAKLMKSFAIFKDLD